MTLSDRYPDFDTLRRRAKRRIPHFAWEYLDSGTGRDQAMARNIAALQQVEFLPRVLCGQVTPKLETRFLGRTYAQPFGISPIGASGLIWPGAEQALARQAAKASIPYVLSTVATRTPEEIGPLCAQNGWFQLYMPGSRDALDDLVNRIEAVGYDTLVLTVDVPVSSRRERQRKAGFRVPAKLTPRLVFHAALCPVWSMGILKYGMPTFRTLLPYIPEGNLADVTRRLASDLHPQPGWDAVERLRARWNGRLIIKGILHPDDAKRALGLGCDAVWVSNHGGRQLDAAPAAIERLAVIRQALGPDAPLLFDSGIRSGLDMARALAVGADMVMVGRPFFYALGALGERGAAHACELLSDELANIMGQIGITDPRALKDAISTHFSA